MDDLHLRRVERHRERQSAVQLVIGIVIATLGVLITLDNLHLADARVFIRLWPIALVAIGLAQIAQARTTSRAWAGSMWIVVGLLMLANRIGFLRVNIWAYWPLLLVFVGGRIFWQSFNRRAAAPLPADGSGNPMIDTGATNTAADATASAVAILGGFDRRITSTAFQHAELTAFMGGGKLDLRDAVPLNGQAVIDVFSVMGGFEIIVPETWTVDIEVTPFLGGCDDKTVTRAGGPTNGPRLLIRGFVMMGGLDIKNR